MLVITRANIPSLFVRFVLSMNGTVSENFIVLTSKKCTDFGLASLLCLVFSNNIRKWLEATTDLQLYFYFPGQTFRTTT